MTIIAQLLKTKEFPLRLYDSNGKVVYHENSDKYWHRIEYDSNGNIIYSEDSTGFWSRYEYDSKGKQTYYENSNGLKEGTPQNQSCTGKIVEIDGKKYKLQEVK